MENIKPRFWAITKLDAGSGRYVFAANEKGTSWTAELDEANWYTKYDTAKEVGDKIGGLVAEIGVNVVGEAPKAEPPTGGYAFARPTSDTPGTTGMFLRDFFAAHALAGYIASHTDTLSPPEDERAARNAYEYADAMIAQRGKPSTFKPKG